MTTFELLLLVENLTRGLNTLGLDERMSLREYLWRRVPTMMDEITRRLQAREFVLWIDGRAVVDLGEPVGVTRASQIGIYQARGSVVEVITPVGGWN